MKALSLDEMLPSVECRYELVTVVSKRAKLLIDKSAGPLIDLGNVKPIIQSSTELHEGCYKYHHSDGEQ